MRATDEEIQANKQMWGDIYLFWRSYYHGENSPKFWEELVFDADRMCERHKGDEFFSQMLDLCVRDIEHRFRNENKTLHTDW